VIVTVRRARGSSEGAPRAGRRERAPESGAAGTPRATRPTAPRCGGR